MLNSNATDEINCVPCFIVIEFFSLVSVVLFVVAEILSSYVDTLFNSVDMLRHLRIVACAFFLSASSFSSFIGTVTLTSETSIIAAVHCCSLKRFALLLREHQSSSDAKNDACKQTKSRWHRKQTEL